jgi:hypothetical protein
MAEKASDMIRDATPLPAADVETPGLANQKQAASA